MDLSDDDLRQYAREGARIQLTRIYEEFPELKADVAETPEEPTRAGRRSGMSALQREAVSKRMKAYWRKRRAAQW